MLLQAECPCKHVVTCASKVSCVATQMSNMAAPFGPQHANAEAHTLADKVDTRSKARRVSLSKPCEHQAVCVCSNDACRSGLVLLGQPGIEHCCIWCRGHRQTEHTSCEDCNCPYVMAVWSL